MLNEQEKRDLALHLLDIIQTPNANKIVYRPYFRSESIYPDEYWLWTSKEVISYPFDEIFKRYYPKEKGYLTIGINERDVMVGIKSDDGLIELTDEMWNNDDFISELKNCKATPIKYIDTFDGKDTPIPNVPINENVYIKVE